MKIVVVGTRGFPNVQGGIETHCQHLYPLLVKKGCSVTVFTRRPYVDASIREYEGVELRPLPCIRNKYLETFLHTLVAVIAARRLHPDIVHFHAVGPSLFVPLARLMGMKTIMTTQGPEYKRKKWCKSAKLVLMFGEFLGARFSQAVIAVSGYIARDIKRKYGRDSVVIPNGVITSSALESTAALERYGLRKGTYILAVARFVPEKGLHDLVDAFCALGQRQDSPLNQREWKLVIAGGADHQDAYSVKLRTKVATNKNIVLTGVVSGTPLKELFSHAGLFVLASYYEGLPIALLEALSYGVSCLATDIEATGDLELEPERLFKPGDVAALSEKIDHFIVRPFDGESSSRQCERMKECYNWESIAEKTIGVYREVCGSEKKVNRYGDTSGHR